MALVKDTDSNTIGKLLLSLAVGSVIGALAAAIPLALIALIAIPIAFALCVSRPKLAFLVWVFSGVLVVPFALPVPKPLSDIRLGEYFLLLLAIGLFARFLVRRRFIHTFLDLPLVILIFLATASVALNLTRVPQVSILSILFNLGGVGLIILCGLSYWITAHLLRSWSDVKVLYRILLLSGLTVAFLGIAYFLLYTDRSLSLSQRTRSTIQAGYLGNFMTALIALATAHLFYAKNLRAKIALLSSWLVFVGALILSVSRSAWIGAFFSVAIILLVKARRWFVGLWVLLIVAAAAMPGAFSRLVGLYLPSDSNYALSRLALWKDAVAVWQSHPVLGIGPGNYYFFGGVWEKGILVGSPHNNYLQIAVEIGLFGLAVLLWLLLSSLRKAWRLYHMGQLGLEKALMLGIFGGLVGLMASIVFGDFFVPSVTNLGFDTFNSIAYVWILLGIIAAVERCGVGKVSADSMPRDVWES